MTKHDVESCCCLDCCALRENTDKMNAEQPVPQESAHPPVWPMVMQDMINRNSAGMAKYGTTLKPHNGRDALIDAYQEALDLCVYMRQAIYERDGR